MKTITPKQLNTEHINNVEQPIEIPATLPFSTMYPCYTKTVGAMDSLVFNAMKAIVNLSIILLSLLIVIFIFIPPPRGSTQ